MTAPVNFYADFKSLAALKNAAGNADPRSDAGALREAARQFESIFTQMMLKSMRDASLGESLMDNDQSKFYLEMFDNQIAAQLSKGRGLGLADMLVRQLTEAGMRPVEKQAPTQGMPLNAEPSKPAPMEIHPAREIQSQPIFKPATQPAIQSATQPTGQAIGQSSQTDQAKVESNKPARQALAHTPAEFIERMLPHAQMAARELGVDAHTLIAHAALETGWGKFVPCNPDGSCSFNMFGIKAGRSWQGDTVGVNTLEFENGVAVRKRDSFRAYDSPAESFRDYAAFIKNNPRYVDAVGTGDDARKFASALQQGGYATDPNYAQKLTRTAMGVIAHAAALLKSAVTQPLASGSSAPGAGVSRSSET